MEKSGYAAAALTIVPIPGSEVVAVMPIHVGMVVGIGHIYGHELSKQTATELVLKVGSAAGLSLVGSRIATTAAKVLLPGLGGLMAAPFMFASTMALGTVARAYFESNGQLSEEDMKSVYTTAQKEAKSSFDRTKMSSEEAQDAARSASEGRDQGPSERLSQLKKLLDQGLIEQTEYDETKARILKSL